MSQAGPHYCLTVFTFTARTQSVRLPQNCLNPQNRTDIVLWGPLALTRGGGCQPSCVQATPQSVGRALRECHRDFQEHRGPFGALLQRCCHRCRVLTDGPGASSSCALWGCPDRTPLPDPTTSVHCSLLLCPSLARALIEALRTAWAQLGFVFCSFLKRSVTEVRFLQYTSYVLKEYSSVLLSRLPELCRRQHSPAFLSSQEDPLYLVQFIPSPFPTARQPVAHPLFLWSAL